jgi:hypothetical protein
MLHNVCLDCGAKFKAERHEDQCCLCKVLESEAYANNQPDVDMPRLLSKPVMQERLSVSGDRDE